MRISDWSSDVCSSDLSAEYLHDRRSIVGAERRIERGSGLFPDQRARVLERERGTVQAIHAGVLPLDRDGTVVTDGAERAEAVLPRDVAVARRHEVPAPTRVTPRPGRAKDPAAAGGVAEPGGLAFGRVVETEE